MYRRQTCPLLFLTVSVLLVFTGVGLASQQLGHIFMALTAFDDAPEGLWATLYQNLDSYVAGATGPDIALISFPLEESREQSHPGEWPHYYSTGEFIMNMLDMAETPAEQAFAWGWLTHYMVDTTIHPLVNAYGGYYTGPTLTAPERAEAKKRHIRLELFENRHVIETAGESAFFPHRYRVDHKAVPVDLIAAAYLKTYPGRTDADLVKRFWAASLAMEVATESFIAEAGGLSMRRRLSDVLSPIPAMFLGSMPTAEEYEQLMNPLVIENVQLVAEGDDLFVEVAYRVNDLRLHKGFADAWDTAYLEAVGRIASVFARHETPPRQLGLPNLDLDIGLPEGRTIDPHAAHPGNPELFWMLVTGSVTNDEGRELSPLAYSDFWVDFEYLDEIVWDGRAGTGTFRLPIDSSAPGPYHVSLRLSFADLTTSEPYFDAGPKSRFEGTLGGETEWKGEFIIHDYKPLYIDDIATWQAAPGTRIPFNLWAEQTAASIRITRFSIDEVYYLNRGVLFLLAPHWTSETLLSPATRPRLAEEMIATWEATMHHPVGEVEPPPWLGEAVQTMYSLPGDYRWEFAVSMDSMLRPVERLDFLGLLDLESGTASGIVSGVIGATTDIVGTWTAEQAR